MRKFISKVKAFICGVKYYGLAYLYDIYKRNERKRGSKEKAVKYHCMSMCYAAKGFSVLYDYEGFLREMAIEYNKQYVKDCL